MESLGRSAALWRQRLDGKRPALQHNQFWMSMSQVHFICFGNGQTSGAIDGGTHQHGEQNRWRAKQDTGNRAALGTPHHQLVDGKELAMAFGDLQNFITGSVVSDTKHMTSGTARAPRGLTSPGMGWLAGLCRVRPSAKVAVVVLLRGEHISSFLFFPPRPPPGPIFFAQALFFLC